MSSVNFLKRLLDGVTVEWRDLGSITTIKTGQAVSKEIISNNPGNFPVINSGKEPLGFINQWNTDNDPIGITSRGAGVGSITWQEGKYFRGNLNYSVTIKDYDILGVRYLYHLLLSLQNEIQSLCTFDGIPALNASNLKNLLIPIPCPDNPQKSLEIQAEIVRILDAMTAHTAELTAELTARKKQYNYYRDKLLSFEDGEVEWLDLDTLAKIKTGQSVNKKMISDNPGEYAVINSGREPLGFIDVWNTDNDPIGITSRGAGVGSITWREGKYFRGNLNYSVTIKNKEKINIRYLYHILQKMQLEIQALCTFDGIPALNASNLKELEIPVPLLDDQNRIVAILDKFDALTASITEGLPREIELRQKQYAYYRDLLLSFPQEQTA